jgi:hypothetical protein
MHPHPVFDESFLVQIATQLSRQRNELDRLRRAVEAAEGSHSNRKPRHAALTLFRTIRPHRKVLSPRGLAP